MPLDLRNLVRGQTGTPQEIADRLNKRDRPRIKGRQDIASIAARIPTLRGFLQRLKQGTSNDPVADRLYGALSSGIDFTALSVMWLQSATEAEFGDGAVATLADVTDGLRALAKDDARLALHRRLAAFHDAATRAIDSGGDWEAIKTLFGSA
jgi:hypothetical protein